MASRHVCAWLAEYVARNRLDIIDMQLAACFPDRDADWVRATRHAFFKSFGNVAAGDRQGGDDHARTKSTGE